MQADDRLREQVKRNALRSVLLVAGFPLILPIVTFVLVLAFAVVFNQPNAAGAAGAAFMVVFLPVVVATIVWLPIGYFLSQSIIDAATGARLVDRSEEPRLWHVFENLCRKCGMRLPALRIIEADELNAFASGLREGQYSVTVTRGLLGNLDEAELEGVLAHELTHIRNYDCRLLVVATILVGLVPILHDLVVRVFWAFSMVVLNLYRGIFSLMPVPGARLYVNVSSGAMYWTLKAVAYVIGSIGYLVSLIIHYALSREREFMADAGAVEMTGNPDAMISALQKIGRSSVLVVKVDGIREMMFENQIAGLFATHPPIEERIKAIRSYGQRQPHHVEAPRAENASTRRSLGPNEESPSETNDDGYYRALMRAMQGAPEMVDPDSRSEIYRRARRALVDHACVIEPPLPEDEARSWHEDLEAAISRIERRVKRLQPSGRPVARSDRITR